MQDQITKYFEKLGFDINTSETYTIWFSLEGKNGFTLQFIYFKDNQTIYSRLAHNVLIVDLFHEFFIDDLKQLDFLINNHRRIKNFYSENELAVSQ